LCNSNHHKWKICGKKQFDVREGRLVTVYECQRCGKQKVTAH
jgi:ribosomal protein L37E